MRDCEAKLWLLGVLPLPEWRWTDDSYWQNIVVGGCRAAVAGNTGDWSVGGPNSGKPICEGTNPIVPDATATVELVLRGLIAQALRSSEA